MSGNVWERGWDWYANPYVDAAPFTDLDSKGPASGTNRFMRGGGIYNATSLMRSSNRGDDIPTSVSSDIGFRLVLP